MKLIVGGMLLLTCFAAASLWQHHWTSAARAARDAVRARPSGGYEGSELPEGWGRVVIGRPSGATASETVGSSPGATHAQGDPSTEATSPAAQRAVGKPPADPQPAEPAAREFRLVVQPGQSLSAICRAHYGSARIELVRALARFNELKNEDQLREGQTLRLPPIERLVDKAR